MSTTADDISPARATQITTNIDRAFDFLQDAHDRPAETVEQIPDGSTLTFREIVAEGRAFRLTASRSAGETEWTARITGYGVMGGAPILQRPSRDDHGRDNDGRFPPAILATTAAGPTADAALVALEAKIRPLMTEAVRVEIDG